MKQTNIWKMAKLLFHGTSQQCLLMEWKNGVGSALTAYAADQTDANWAKVVSAFVDGWATEAAASK